MFKFLSVSFLLFIALSGKAQEMVEGLPVYHPDSFEIHYQTNFNLSIDKFEREHLDIDGDEVDYIPFRQDELFGFVKKGKPNKWVIQPRYAQVFTALPDVAIVKDTSFGYGIIDYNGAYLCAPGYTNIIPEGSVLQGIYYGATDSALNLTENYNSCYYVHYFDTKGNFLFEEAVHDKGRFTAIDTLAWFRFGLTYSIRSTSGRLVKQFRHSDTVEFIGVSNNLLVFRRGQDENSYYTLETPEGIVVTSLPLNEGWLYGIMELSPNLFGLIGNDGEYYFCDSLGNPYGFGSYTWAIGFFSGNPEFFMTENFRVSDRNTGKYGMINRNGDTLIDFEYSYLSTYVNDYAFGVRNDTSYFIDKDGNHVFAKAHLHRFMQKHHGSILRRDIGFYDDLCLAEDYKVMEYVNEEGETRNYIDEDSTYFFYIDIKGNKKLELPTTIRFAGVFNNGLAPAADKDYKLGFVNKKGQWVIAPRYELTMAGAYPFPYLVIPEFNGGYAYIKAFKGYIDKKGNEYFSGKRLQDHYDFSH